VGSCPLDYALAEAAALAEPPLEPGHPAVIALVIIAEQVQQAMERQDTQFCCERMTRVAGLASGDSGGNYDVTEVSALVCRE
jgi:hypothetical protein